LLALRASALAWKTLRELRGLCGTDRSTGSDACKRAPSRMASQSAPYSMPAAAAIFGSSDVGVIPGSVLTSRTYSFSPSVTSKSTRHAPVHDSERAARSARFITPRSRVAGKRGGDTYSVAPGVYFAP